MEKVKEFLQSIYFVPVILSVLYLGWFFSIPSAMAIIMGVFIALIFLLCDDIKNIFVPFLFVAFFLQDIEEGYDMVSYSIAAAIAFAALIGFIVRKIVAKKSEYNFGNLKVPFIISTVAFLIGGIDNNFDLLRFLIVFGFCVLNYAVYFVSLNFTEDLENYLCKMFIIGSVFLFAVYFTSLVRTGDVFASVLNREITWVGAEPVNTTSLYFMISIIAVFYLSFGKKYDWVYVFVAELFFLALFAFYCRTVIVISIILFIVMFVLAVKNSHKKRNYLLLIAITLFIFGLFCIFEFDTVKTFFVDGVISKMQQVYNGRDRLFVWCFNKIKQHPVFGIGFIVYEDVPAVRNMDNVAFQPILAHNTILQWLVSMGVVGLALMTVYYVGKYKTLFYKAQMKDTFCIVAVLAIALSGMVDQAAAMDPFIFAMPIIMIAALERERIKDNRMTINNRFTL